MEPPKAITIAIAFSKASLVIISLGFKSRSIKLLTAFPASSESCSFTFEVASCAELFGKLMPIASIADAIVFAVYMPPQEPGPGIELDSMSNNSMSEISPSESFPTASKTDIETYPPYNIEKVDEDDYRITMAVAGFSNEDLDLIQKENALFIKGQANIKNTKTEYLHRGIAARSFERRFSIADHVNVIGANLQNGILTIELKRDIPEALKPRKIKIFSGDSGSSPIEQKAA